MKHRISIPARFAEDHYERDLPCGDVIKTGKRLWTFDCAVDDLREWLSDADYHSDCAGPGWDCGEEDGGYILQSSARATVRKLLPVLKKLDALPERHHFLSYALRMRRELDGEPNEALLAE